MLNLPTGPKPPAYRDIPGWFDFLDVYQRAVREAPANATFVEVGVLFGASLAALVDEVEKSKKNIHIHGIDTWDPEFYQNPWIRYDINVIGKGDPMAVFHHHMERLGMRQKVTTHKGRSVDVASKFADGSLDFVFLDGSHLYEDLKQECFKFMPKLRSHSILAGHDYDHKEFPGVVRVVNELFGNDVEIIGRSWWHEWIH